MKNHLGKQSYLEDHMEGAERDFYELLDLIGVSPRMEIKLAPRSEQPFEGGGIITKKTPAGGGWLRRLLYKR